MWSWRKKKSPLLIVYKLDNKLGFRPQAEEVDGRLILKIDFYEIRSAFAEHEKSHHHHHHDHDGDNDDGYC